MDKKEMFTSVLADNAAQRKLARELNGRVGESILPVLEGRALQEWMLARLAGAGSVSAVADPEQVRLPSLDQEMVNLVQSEYPEQIVLLGQPRTVEYKAGAAPRVRLDKDILNGPTPSFVQLPDEGVKLPGGRALEPYVQIDGWTKVSAGVNIPQFKAELAQHVNNQAWQAWQSRPSITLPAEPLDETSTVSAVQEAHYGQCVLSQAPFVAYGAVVFNRDHYRTSDPLFKSAWFQTRQEAEAAREQAVAKMEELRREVVTRRELEVAQREAQPLQARIAELYQQLSSAPLVTELVNRLGSMGHLPSNLEGVHNWADEARLLIAKAEAALVREQERARLAAQLDEFSRRLTECPGAQADVDVASTLLTGLQQLVRGGQLEIVRDQLPAAQQVVEKASQRTSMSEALQMLEASLNRGWERLDPKKKSKRG